MTGSTRHHWGPAPSGEPQHRAVCRRCGLEEVTTWRRHADGRVIEVVTWRSPTGQVLAARAVRSQQVPHGLGPLPALEEPAVAVPPTADALTHCPGTWDAWRS